MQFAVVDSGQVHTSKQVHWNKKVRFYHRIIKVVKPEHLRLLIMPFMQASVSSFEYDAIVVAPERQYKAPETLHKHLNIRQNH